MWGYSCLIKKHIHVTHVMWVSFVVYANKNNITWTDTCEWMFCYFVLCTCICINIHIWVWLHLVLFAHVTARHPPATTALCRLLSQQLAMQRIWKTFVSFKNQTLSAWGPLPPRASDMSEYEHHCICAVHLHIVHILNSVSCFYSVWNP